MPKLRFATVEDAALITAQRHRMFADNGFAGEADYAAMSEAFEPWVRERLADGRYVGVFLEEDASPGPVVIAAAGIFFMDFPPHWMDPSPERAYLLNFYTAAEARGRGLATELLGRCVEECRRRKVKVVTLHASKFGRPVYERFGFSQHNEMVLRLND
jgi:GNAT superfamily N-acetyltransferase